MPYFYWKANDYTGTTQDTIYRTTTFTGTASPRNKITIPLGRGSSLSNNPIWVKQVKMYLAGKGASRTVSIVVGSGKTSNFSVANAGTSIAEPRAADTDWKDLSYKYSSTTAASIDVGFNHNGETWFGRYGTTADLKTMWGRCFYTQVPTGPTSVSATSPSAGTLKVTWGAPSDDGGASVSGYIVHYSTSSSFASFNSSGVVSSSPFEKTGLTSGTVYYVRVFAVNEIYYNFSNNPTSITSQVANVTISAPPKPIWTTPATIADKATIGTAFSTTVVATNATSYSRVSGDSWLSVSSTGVISGTAPNTVGTAKITVRATNANAPAPNTEDREFSITIDGPAPTWNTSSPLTDASAGTYYSTQLSASAGVGAVSYSKLTGGTNDSWVTINSSGLLSGTAPTSTGSVTVKARATGNGKDTDKDFTFSIIQSAPVWTTGTTLPSATATLSYSTSVSASATSSYSKVSGDSWVLVSSGGTVTGTPPSAGNSSVTIRATGPTSLTADRTFTIPVAAAPVPVWTTSSPLQSVVAGAAYSTSVVATGAASYTKLPGGTNDSWITVSTGGSVYGVSPSTAGSTVVKIRATNSSGGTSDKDFAITITTPPPAWITNATLIGGKAGVAYSATVSASNANTYTISGSKPDWLSLNTATGVLSGTPTENGTVQVTIIPSGPGGTGPSRTFSIAIGAAAPDWIDATLQDQHATLNVEYSDGFSASDVLSSNAYLITGLPTGLTYSNITGEITGAPTQTGTFNVTARAYGLDGSSITTTSVLYVYYPGKRMISESDSADITRFSRWNGSSWVAVQFVKRRTQSGWDHVIT
jgi:hypothetical protein